MTNGKTMIMKKIFTILAIATVLMSCNKDDNDIYYKIPQTIKPLCTKGQVFSYYSADNGRTVEWTVDSVVKEKYNITVGNHYQSDRYTTYYSTSDFESITIIQNYGGISWLGWSRPYIEFHYTPESVEYVSIGNDNYYVDVLTLEEYGVYSNHYYDSIDYQRYPTEIYCSHQCGVLRFSYGDSITYEIVNPLPEKYKN